MLCRGPACVKLKSTVYEFSGRTPGGLPTEGLGDVEGFGLRRVSINEHAYGKVGDSRRVCSHVVTKSKSLPGKTRRIRELLHSNAQVSCMRVRM